MILSVNQGNIRKLCYTGFPMLRKNTPKLVVYSNKPLLSHGFGGSGIGCRVAGCLCLGASPVAAMIQAAGGAALSGSISKLTQVVVHRIRFLTGGWAQGLGQGPPYFPAPRTSSQGSAPAWRLASSQNSQGESRGQRETEGRAFCD